MAEKKTGISCDKNTLTIAYEGWVCHYTTSGIIEDLGGIAYNRNGYYRRFLAVGEKNLNVKIEIIPKE